MPLKKILILGGSSEAAALARHLCDRLKGRVDVVVSYSGITGHQPDLPCSVHVGGFGGASGLIEYIAEQRVDFMIDATHPYAEKISQNIYVAAQATEVPCVVLMRLPWMAGPKDRWLSVSNMEEAAQKVGEFNVPTFLSIGIKELSAFEELGDVPLLVRLLKQPDEDLNLDHYELVCARPPFDVEAEKQLMRSHNIRLLVTKNSGGEKTISKIQAARELGIAVVMVDRPPSEPLDHVATISDVEDWLLHHGL